jgi:hypothetical protein
MILLLLLLADEPNKPPKLAVQKEVHATAGAELDVAVNATDPEGEALSYAVENLPAGARFVDKTGDLLWTPTNDDAGIHDVTLSASDGHNTTYALVRIFVAARPKLAIQVPSTETLEVGKPFSLLVTTNAPTARLDVTGLPEGATFDAHTIAFTPSDVGDHPVHIVAATADEKVEHDLVLHVRPPREEWMSYALPGVGYSAYLPFGSADVGLMQGPSFELVVVQWVHRNDNMGPSHGRVALKADLLFPLNDGGEPAIVYAASLALSLERNPERSFLLPYFAVDVGGLYQKKLGNAFQVTPSVGVHLFQNRNVFVSLDAGYLLALPSLEKLHGPRVALSGNFTLW